MASVVGIESIHTMRQGSYITALQLAFQAIGHIEECREAAPQFVDLQLADGMYNYWRTVVTMSSKVLPDFGDQRKLGIDQMSRVQRDGIFVRPLASLALAYTWMEEKDWTAATKSCASNRANFPDSVINNMICGQIDVYAGNFERADESFERIMAVDPANARVHYLRGWALLKQHRLDEAELEFQTYLSEPYLETWQRSYSHFRLGQIAAERKQFAAAIESWQTAVKIDGHKEAKAQIAALEQLKRQGTITW
jgi:predicted Zn-dependent protease